MGLGQGSYSRQPVTTEILARRPPFAVYHRTVRAWGLGGVLLLVAMLAGLVSWAVLDAALPRPLTAAPGGPVLETVTPAQLTTMGVRMEATIQPIALPDWMSSHGVRPPSTIVFEPDAVAAVHRVSGGVRSVSEATLAYATVTAPNLRLRGGTISHRLVWAVVGMRRAAASAAGVQVLWLVDAHTGRQLTELTVPAAAPALGGLPAGRS
jgi:hypothetical protein